MKKWKMYSPSFPLVLFLGSIPCLLVLSIAETQLSALIHLNRSERGERGGRGGKGREVDTRGDSCNLHNEPAK